MNERPDAPVVASLQQRADRAGDMLARRVAALLADGLEPEDLDKVRRRLGMQARPSAVVDVLEARRGTRPTDVVPEGLHVMGGQPGLSDRLAQTWEQGGPLWVWRRATTAWQEAPLSVGLVGTRRPTLDGLRLAEQIAADLAEAGVELVSGLARGIDQAAHKGAVDAGGATCAVLGTGLDVRYPRAAPRLRSRIAASAGLVSEYAADRGVVHRTQFIARNRILAGLTDGVVVIEAGARSGALNTAGWAGHFGRELMVVPSSPTNLAAAGSLALLRDGATPVRHAADVLDALGATGTTDLAAALVARRPQAKVQLSATARRMVPLLGPVAASVSDLADALEVDARQVLIAISNLEEAGLAVRTAGGVVAQVTR